jgi:hypothetical protein
MSNSDDWQPIETAPAPAGEVVLVGIDGTGIARQAYKSPRSGAWHHAHSADLLCFMPTHWRLMPVGVNGRRDSKTLSMIQENFADEASAGTQSNGVTG